VLVRRFEKAGAQVPVHLDARAEDATGEGVVDGFHEGIVDASGRELRGAGGSGAGGEESFTGSSMRSGRREERRFGLGSFERARSPASRAQPSSPLLFSSSLISLSSL
jgi:hypothetical protein